MSIKIKTPLEKHLELPEGYPAELIEGEIVVTPSPGVRHQEIAIDISSKMKFFADERNAGKVLYEIDDHFDEENVLRPDVIFVKNENKGGRFSLICHGKRCSSRILDGFEWRFSENC